MSEDHKCEPADSEAPFWWDCKVCGEQIEPVFCKDCGGSGIMRGIPHVEADCWKCDGGGVQRWVKAT